MGRKDIFFIFLSLVFALLLYIGLSRMIDFSLFTKGTVVNVLRPFKTGHEGERVPDIELITVDSISKLKLESIPSGRPVVLFYFSVECPYCEMQTREILNNINRLKNIEFYLITPYPYTYMKRFSEKFKLEMYSNVVIGSEVDPKFGNYFGIQYVPFLAVYSKDGRLKSAFNRILTSDQIISECLK